MEAGDLRITDQRSSKLANAECERFHKLRCRGRQGMRKVVESLPLTAGVVSDFLS